MVLQVEYYFSDENLPTDKYMMGFIKKNKEGFGMS
jgi:La-related protein 7